VGAGARAAEISGGIRAQEITAVALLGSYFILARIDELPPLLINLQDFMREKAGLGVVLLLVLLPVAMTMALIWKTKEIILTSVFGPEH